jgi:mannose-6-phosphate isomerase|tara:strand:+ start:135 stop:491 length:357 start_codon:yes stop_codon:yes gene_type:complete
MKIIIEKIIKPWGYEQIIEINKKYLLKKLFMKKNNRCSLQYHNKKRETIYVLSGKLRIYIGKKKEKLKSKIYEKGSSITIQPKVIHRMKALTDCLYLEASTPQNKDVVRLSDDYKRVI